MVKVRRLAGFTLMETLAGLIILAVLLGAIAVLSGPVITRLPALGEQGALAAKTALLQNLLLRAGSTLDIPWWWPPEAISIGSRSVQVHDLSARHVLKETELPDLLVLEESEGVLILTTGGIEYRFDLGNGIRTTPLTAESGRIVGVEILVGEGEDAVRLTLPFNSTVWPEEE